MDPTALYGRSIAEGKKTMRDTVIRRRDPHRPRGHRVRGRPARPGAAGAPPFAETGGATISPLGCRSLSNGLASFVAGAALPAFVPLLGLLLCGLFTDLLPRDDAYEAVEYGFSLLASAGTAGCLGYLFARLPRVLQGLPFSRPAFLRLTPAAIANPGIAPGEGWPLLISLPFGAFFVLLAGLAGWVAA